MHKIKLPLLLLLSLNTVFAMEQQRVSVGVSLGQLDLACCALTDGKINNALSLMPPAHVFHNMQVGNEAYDLLNLANSDELNHRIEQLPALELLKINKLLVLVPLMKFKILLEAKGRNNRAKADDKTFGGALNTRNKLLNLSSLDLKTLPSTVKYLSWLVALDLGNNKLVHFPDEISVLRNLEDLNISSNNWRNISAISSLGRLTRLSMTNIPFDKVSTEVVGQLSNLEYLHIDMNDLTVIPAWVKQLQKLMLLDMNCNCLKRLPPDISCLTSLEKLELSFNQLDTLDGLSSLQKLSTLVADSNKLTSLEAIVPLVHLYEATFCGNRITHLPAGMNKLAELYYIALVSNDITTLPREMLMMKSLKKIFVDKKHFENSREVAELRAQGVDVDLYEKVND